MIKLIALTSSVLIAASNDQRHKILIEKAWKGEVAPCPRDYARLMRLEPDCWLYAILNSTGTRATSFRGRGFFVFSRSTATPALEGAAAQEVRADPAESRSYLIAISTDWNPQFIHRNDQVRKDGKGVSSKDEYVALESLEGETVFENNRQWWYQWADKALRRHKK